MHVDQTVKVTCDGCKGELLAKISFIAREAEFTPPVIFSQEQRQKLVFLVEARPVEATAKLTAGQPVTVSLGPEPQVVRAMKEIAIDVEGLTKSFAGRTVVRDLTLKVPKGEIYGFLGPNGSGKTTTIRMLCGLLTPDSGRGTCLGYDILTQAGRDQARRRLHDPALQPL